MDLRRGLLVSVGALAIATAEPAEDPFRGTWKVDPGNCNLGAIKPDSNRDVIKIDISGEEYRTTYLDGRTLLLRVDGKPHKPSGGAFGATTASEESVARRVDERTIELTTKRNGKTVGKLLRQVSPDGRILTFTTQGTSASGESVAGVCIYKRQ